MVSEAEMIAQVCRVTAFVVLALIAVVEVASAGYYPGRPTGATLQTFTGTITYYSKGMGSGSFGLTIHGVDTSFYLGNPVTINGKVVNCQDADFPSGFFCKDWPKALVLGKSVVTATCWRDTMYIAGKSTWFCDEIDSGTQPRRKSGIGASHTS